MLGVCFCYVILNKTPLIELHKNPLLVTSILTILLILSFWFNGLEGCPPMGNFGSIQFLYGQYYFTYAHCLFVEAIKK